MMLHGDAPKGSGTCPLPTASAVGCTPRPAKRGDFVSKLLFLAGEFLSHLQKIFPSWPGTCGPRVGGGEYFDSPLSPQG